MAPIKYIDKNGTPKLFCFSVCFVSGVDSRIFVTFL